MDTAKVLKRQLTYCLRGAETDAQRDQVRFWIQLVDEHAHAQPAAADEPATTAGQPAAAAPAAATADAVAA